MGSGWAQVCWPIPFSIRSIDLGSKCIGIAVVHEPKKVDVTTGEIISIMVPVLNLFELSHRGKKTKD